MNPPTKFNDPLVERVRQFVKDEILPVASRLEHADEYPAQIVEGFKRLGLFGCNVPRDFGGLGLDYTTFAKIIEELARGWMSVVGPLGTGTADSFREGFWCTLDGSMPGVPIGPGLPSFPL